MMDHNRTCAKCGGLISDVYIGSPGTAPERCVCEQQTILERALEIAKTKPHFESDQIGLVVAATTESTSQATEERLQKLEARIDRSEAFLYHMGARWPDDERFPVETTAPEGAN